MSEFFRQGINVLPLLQGVIRQMGLVPPAPQAIYPEIQSQKRPNNEAIYPDTASPLVKPIALGGFVRGTDIFTGEVVTLGPTDITMMHIRTP